MERIKIIIAGILMLCSNIVISQNEVSFKIEKFGGGLLPQNSKVIVLTRVGTKRQIAPNNEMPTLPFVQQLKIDELSSNSKTLSKYPVTKSENGKIYFTYILTPDDEIFYSADKQKLPEYKQIVSGLIYVQKLPKTHPKWIEIYNGFIQGLHFKIVDKETKEALPENTELVIFQKSKDSSQTFQFPLESNFIRDRVDENGLTKKKYKKTADSNFSYFIYAFTREGRLFFTSNRSEQPLYDVVESGEMHLTNLYNSKADYKEILEKYFGSYEDFAEANADNIINDLGENEFIETEIVEPTSEISEFEITEDEVTEESINLQSGNQFLYYSLTFLAVLLFYFLLKQITYSQQLCNFIYLGFFSTIVLSATIPSFPIIFSIVGLILGFYLTLNVQEAKENKLLTLLTYTIGGFAYCFFLQAIITDIALEGKTLKDGPNDLIYMITSFATAVAVHIICVSFFVMGKSNILIKILSYIGIISFIPLLFGAPILLVQIFLIHYIFLVIFITLIVNFVGNNRYSNSFGILGIVLPFISVLLNYTIVFSPISGAFNLGYENKFSKSGRLNASQKKTSRLLAISTFLFFSIYLFGYSYFGQLLMNLGFDKNLQFALPLGVIGILPITALGTTIFKNEK